MNPEELHVAPQLRERGGLHLARVHEDLLAELLDVESLGAALLDVDRTPGDGGLVQVPGESALARLESLEAVRVDTHDRGIVDALEQVGSSGCARRAAGLEEREAGESDGGVLHAGIVRSGKRSVATMRP